MKKIMKKIPKKEGEMHHAGSVCPAVWHADTRTHLIRQRREERRRTGRVLALLLQLLIFLLLICLVQRQLLLLLMVVMVVVRGVGLLRRCVCVGRRRGGRRRVRLVRFVALVVGGHAFLLPLTHRKRTRIKKNSTLTFVLIRIQNEIR